MAKTDFPSARRLASSLVAISGLAGSKREHGWSSASSEFRLNRRSLLIR